MNTKESILETALELYNECGISAITSRHIAAKMGISAGNLHYHFKRTDDIIKALYDQLAAGFDEMALLMESSTELQITDLREASKQSLELMYKYRFVFLHFVEITFRIPAIREDYKLLTQRRTLQFMNIFQRLMQLGILRKDVSDKILKSLVSHIFIISDFWLSNNEITLRLRGREAIDHYNEIFFNLLYPYFAQSAQEKLD